MKVSPLAQGTGMPTAQIADAGTSTNRKAAAKAAFMGTTIIPSENPVDPLLEASQRSVRKLKMRTNASPDRLIEATEEPITTQTATQEPQTSALEAQDGTSIGISDTIEPGQAQAEETKPLSPQFAALARQKRALQVKEGEIRQREEALKAREATGVPNTDIMANLKADPLSVLQQAGVTYDQLTEAILANPGNGPANAEIQSLKAELKSIKEGLDKNFEDRDNQQREQAVKEMRREADRLSFSGDDFEQIRETKSQHLVTALIEAEYDKSGEIMDVEEAMRLVEDELVEESVLRARSKKVQARLVPAETPEVQQPQQRQIRTLTNRDGARIPLTPRERAILAFKGELKR